MKSIQEISYADRAFALAIDSRAFADAALLLQQGADINRILSISETIDRDVYEDTATYLHFAALLGRADTTAFLLSHGADPNIKGVFSGRTPLLAAARRGYTQLVRMLIEHGADVNAIDTYDNSNPIHYAISLQNADMTRLLIAAGARGSFCCLKFNGPQADADLDIARMLLAQGADLEERDNWGRNCLMWAAERAPIETIRFLITAGADVNAVSIRGSNGAANNETALQLARRTKREDVVTLLLQQGAVAVRARYESPQSVSGFIKSLFGLV